MNLALQQLRLMLAELYSDQKLTNESFREISDAPISDKKEGFGPSLSRPLPGGLSFTFTAGRGTEYMGMRGMLQC